MIFLQAHRMIVNVTKLYGEIHTGDSWVPALTQQCGTNGVFMPVALVLFGDKSHTDLHGLLSVEPVSFTLSLCSIGRLGISLISGACSGTFLIYLLEWAKQIVHWQVIRFRTFITVFHLFSNHCVIFIAAREFDQP